MIAQQLVAVGADEAFPEREGGREAHPGGVHGAVSAKSPPSRCPSAWVWVIL